MTEPIVVTRSIFLDPSEIKETFVRSTGPGGQNVNKVSSAVQLRFDLGNSPNIPEAIKRRVATLAGRRLTRQGVLVITANSHRDQPLNRAEALERLVDLLVSASHMPRPRIATHPSPASKRRRLESKSIRSAVKRLRGNPQE